MWQINLKITQTKSSYIICIPHQGPQVLPLIKCRWVHCIIHQAFLYTRVPIHACMFSSHIRFNISSTPAKRSFPTEQHPLIGHFRHSNHRQQQQHGTLVCRRIRIASWPCQQMLKSATDALTCSQKNFVSHHTISWSSTWIGVWYAGTTT